jgi:hypothetical protein
MKILAGYSSDMITIRIREVFTSRKRSFYGL